MCCSLFLMTTSLLEEEALLMGTMLPNGGNNSTEGVTVTGDVCRGHCCRRGRAGGQLTLMKFCER